ncbi:putative methylenetetrahydrofolate reductase [Symbiodinium microadriaticum]|uniref:Putative methylenetetrahydrofolate reductase n=1 Tax=Symbiodinium microadriaticum TaxID=2951 RepID=A0A1Q9C047_SYMMI|nr:putative methylenetetrahydrofolate reductase [Symbiodinium microadriaticum]
MAQQLEGHQKISDLVTQVLMHALGPLFSDFASGPSSTPERALQLTSKAKNHFGVLAGMHLNCTNKSSEMTGNALLKCKQRGVHGHPLGTAGGFSSALDLLKFIRQNHDDYFSVSVVDSDAKFMVRFSDVGKTVLAMIYAGRPMRCLGRLLAHPRLRGGLMGQRRVAFRVLVRSLLVPAPPPPGTRRARRVPQPAQGRFANGPSPSGRSSRFGSLTSNAKLSLKMAIVFSTPWHCTPS